MPDTPKVVVIGGPNGAGKSTAASRILQDALAVQEFVNADVIARGLSAFKPETVARVEERVRSGGHYVPEETVRRRFRTGLKNFFDLYRPLATSWQMVNNENVVVPQVIARGIHGLSPEISDASLWNAILREQGYES